MLVIAWCVYLLLLPLYLLSLLLIIYSVLVSTFLNLISRSLHDFPAGCGFLSSHYMQYHIQQWNSYKITLTCPFNFQVTIACDAVLNAPSPYKKQELDSWEEEIQVSKHARSLRQQENGVRIPPRLVTRKPRVIRTSPLESSDAYFRLPLNLICLFSLPCGIISKQAIDVYMFRITY